MPDIPTLTSGAVILRKIRESDIDDRFVIGRHHEFAHMCGADSMSAPDFPERSFWEDWYRCQIGKEYSWIIDIGGKCVGAAKFSHISPADKTATYSIGIFDPNLHSKGIGTIVTKLMLEYGFETLHFHRIDLKVLEYNFRGIRCYEKCGFKKEGVLRDSAFIDGQHYSDILMSITEDEYTCCN
ncbi:MAG TPA: GNAT family protein [Oscillospiraceae bacterium]|nr:GNAT family protein [Oscillospiraceae bacterium]HPF55552.1 GNAT family protein [Clostridiales bacterium]HPK34662.1 GNAT family protein [Oscillospiraceae bacterium]HPR74574.1 GNAT family protein [Oscillospiraceae bacterium]